MANAAPVIVWFRQDLRTADNPALRAAAATGMPLVAVYVLDDDNAGEWAMGAASRWWLHHSLARLNESLGGNLTLLRGKADEWIPRLARDTGAQGVYWNRCYEPWRIARDKKIKQQLAADDREGHSFAGSLLFEPHTVSKADGGPYKMFTPFYRKGCLQRQPTPRDPMGPPESLRWHGASAGAALDELGLMPSVGWYEEMAQIWTPGEAGAGARLDRFLQTGIAHYREGRDRPAEEHVSRLSPHLHFGEISPFQVWQAVAPLSAQSNLERHVDHFLSELGWREFSNNLLYHWPEITRQNLQSKFDRFPWRDDPDALRCWQRGITGYPIVDAGMRELWRTGYMHNRVRMIVGSFLVKNLMLHWHHGEDWFWDTLLDADLANNSASWQWIAGCGADAAPYFRIFNPVTQGRKFDPDGVYVGKYVPELRHLPARYVHCPWEAPGDVLKEAGVILGSNYPAPIVDLKDSRERALAAFKSLSGAT